MDKNYNPFELPQDLEKVYREADQQFYILLQEGKFVDAKKILGNIYELFLKKQKKLGRRLHKGGVVHNLGIIALLTNDVEWAFKYFLLGFAEDVASQEQGFGGEAEGAPGAQNLKTFFGADQELFSVTRNAVISKLKKGQFNDPKTTFREFLNAQIEKPKVKDRVEVLKKTPFIVQKKYSINRIPGNWVERVFIGGNYSGERVKNLFEIKKVVENKKYIPIIALEFNDTEPPVHDHSLLLLHNCKYAIFDVSADSGYLMEVERTLDYRTKALLVYEEIPEFRITEMIKSLGFELKKFSSIEELHNLVEDFIKVNK